ncbi:MAG: NAD(P)/FAD-dependent oxidoreductase [Pseudomonadales bacterium]|nr:NAD(P)/FAD-dependent oxidoreductase [Pseudomonadales bacterium]
MSSTENLAEAIEAMREKYRVEREKRLRPDGSEQFVEIKGEFSRFGDDPFAQPLQRNSRTTSVEMVVVGGGFGGLLTAARMNAVGIKDICVIEEGADFGGTWYWNRYPGAQCDIESYVYMPLLEELGYVPTEKYAHADELFSHSRAIAEHYNLYKKALLQTRMVDAIWQEETCTWMVLTDQGDEIKARYLVLATGNLTRPKLPGIPGIEQFQGHMFHTSRWDYAYTGSDGRQDLSDLGDKKVAIIGSGATAVQVVPSIAESVAHLYVCQRTPSTIDVRGNGPTDEAWFSTLEKGWQQARIENLTNILNGMPQAEDLVADGWTDLMHKMIDAHRQSKKGVDLGVDPRRVAQYRKMEEIRSRVDSLVDDPETAEALKPYYDMFCKRPCFHDEYLPTFNRDNVTLLDTDGKGVESITETGVVVQGTEYEVDCIIFATGFEVGVSMQRRVGIDLQGVGDLKLSDKWAEGPRTMHGMHVHGFPNAFVLGGVQSTIAFNVPHHLDEQARTLARLLEHAKNHKFSRIEATQEAEQEWVDAIINDGQKVSMPGQDPCTPGYYNNEGQSMKNGRYFRAYRGGPPRYFRKLKEWCDNGDFEGISFS